MSLIIHAPNIHQGGGKALLLPLLEAARKQGSVRVILDKRLTVPASLIDGLTAVRVRPSILGRLAGEWTLRSWVKETDTVLCFGNLPPLFHVKGKVVVFLQNRYLLTKLPLQGFPWRTRMRIRVERLCLARRIRRADTVVVQTPSMQQEVFASLGVPSRLLPFCASCLDYRRSMARIETRGATLYDFVYVATGEPHKNHWTLLEAWRLLAVDGLRPSLCLTIPEDRFPQLVAAIRRVSGEHSLRIENRVFSLKDLQTLYTQAGTLIYPSLTESLGLPLIEARAAGLPIIAGELDYVRDVVDPEETFDPQSPVSLARAVKRFLGQEEPALPLLRPEEFLQSIVANH